MQLRDYQKRAIQGVYASWDEYRKTLLVLPTGTGKTIIFSNIAKREIEEGNEVLILAHRNELIKQAQDKLKQATGLDSAIEKAGDSCLNSFFQVTCGSVQTLMRQSRLNRFPKDYFETIIVDEAHHVLSLSYQNILNHFNQAKVLGVTATPDRGDKKNLGAFFDDLAFEYSVRDAISEGWLCPIEAETIPLNIDLQGVRVTAGDFNDRDLGNALDPYLSQIAENIPENRKTLIFLPLIVTSERMTNLLLQRGLKAEHIDGTSRERAETLARFKSGETKIICNSMLLTEGFDEPSIDCVVCLRPTKIRSLFAQIVGRGTRPLPGKKLLILDFLWHTARHDLCHPASLLAENEEIAKKMTEIQEQTGGALDLTQLEIEAKGKVTKEREEKLARDLKEHKAKKRRTVNPLEFALSLHDEALQTYEPTFPWEKQPPTDNQLRLLTKFGFDQNEIPTKGFASMLITRCISRSKRDLATPKQVKLLERYDYENAGMFTFQEASQLIDTLAQNGWRREAVVC